MNKKDREELQLRYYEVVMDYCKAFSDKQEMEFSSWVGDEVGGVGWFNDFTLDFADVKYDIDNNIKKGLIVDWYYESVDAAMSKAKRQVINYKSYCMGLRFDMFDKK